MMHGVHKNQHNVVTRLKRVEGQIRGVQKMVQDDRYCIDIIVQTSAIKQAISTIEDIMLESHLNHCLTGEFKGKKADTVQDEILKVYKLKKK